MTLSDPQLMRATGYRTTYVRGRAGAPGLERSMLTDSTLLTPVYIDADNELLETDHRVFVVVREPIGLARSWLRTNLANHPSNADVDARRHVLTQLVSAGAPPIDVLAASLDEGFSATLRIASTWVERAVTDPSVLVTTFEDLTHPQHGRREMARIFDHVGFGDHVDLIDVIDRRYRKSNVARVERVLRPAAERKYGTATTGDEAVQAALTDDDIVGVIHEFAPELVGPLHRFYERNASDDVPLATASLQRSGERS